MNPARDHPGRGGGRCGVCLAHSSGRLPGRSLCTTPLARPGACEGERGAAGSAFAAPCVLFVCLGRAGSSLFTGESHPETPALFLSGLSQVEESIKPPDRGKGRQSGAQSENRPAPGSDPCSGGRCAGPAMRALWLSCCVCFALLLPAARATQRRQGESASGGHVAALGCALAFRCTL